MEIPLFCSVNDPDAYLRWVQKVEDVFDSEEFSAVQKCRRVSRQFRGRVLTLVERFDGIDEREWE